ncbi:plasmid mobilization protein [Nocardia farcinica]
MAGESRNQRAGVRRTRQANVPGGRAHRCVVKLSDSEYADLTARAVAAGMTVPRLLVETTLGKATPEAGRAAAALRALEEGEQGRRVLNNLNQLTRYSHQNRELAEGLPLAVAAVVRAALQMDALARWVMGETPAVSPAVIGEDQLAAAQEWAERVDNLGVPGIDDDIDDMDGGGV